MPCSETEAATVATVGGAFWKEMLKSQDAENQPLVFCRSIASCPFATTFATRRFKQWL